MKIGSLFDVPVRERIEPVVKVEELDDAAQLAAELDGTVITEPVEGFIDAWGHEYARSLGRRSAAIGVWLSGPFGSGKSHLAKLLSLAARGAPVAGASFESRLVARLSPRSPHRDRIARSLAAMRRQPSAILPLQLGGYADGEGSALARVLLGALYRRRGYSGNVLYAHAVEAPLDRVAKLDGMRRRAAELTKVDFDEIRQHPAAYHQALCQASSEAAPELFGSPQAVEQALERTRVGEICTVEAFVAVALAELETTGQARLLLVLDEAGSWAKASLGRLAELQALVEQAAVRGRGRLWVVAVAHEDLADPGASWHGAASELAAIESRFAHRVCLTAETIGEVVERRLLTKKARGARELDKLYRARGGALREMGELRCPRRALPECTQGAFVRHYPLLPYQLPLIVEVVRELRLRAGHSPLLAGSTRTLLGIVQDVLRAGRRPYLKQTVGSLVSFDEIYGNLADAGEIPEPVRVDIGRVDSEVVGATAGTARTAEVLYLLGLVGGVPATVDNIARLRVQAADQDLLDRVAQTKAELERLVAAHLVVRVGDEYEWLLGAARQLEAAVVVARQKMGAEERSQRLFTSFVQGDGQARFGEWLGAGHVSFQGKRFGFKLRVDGRAVRGRRGDVTLDVTTGVTDSSVAPTVDELAVASREPDHGLTIFLRLAADEKLVARLDQLLALEQVLAQWPPDGAAQEDELEAARRRRVIQLPELRRRVLSRLDAALGGGVVVFRGQVRSLSIEPGESGASALQRALQRCWHALYTKFERVPVRIVHEQPVLRALLAGQRPAGQEVERLRLHDEQGRLDPASPVLDAIRMTLATRGAAPHGRDGASGRDLLAALSAPPYGWDAKAVWVGTAALACAGLITMQVGGLRVDVAAHPDGRRALQERKAFEACRFSAVPRGSNVEQLTAARQLLVHLTRRRTVDETVPAVSAAAGRLADRMLAMADAARLWLDGAGQPLSAEALAGIERWASLRACAEPHERVSRLAEEAESLCAGHRAIEALLDTMPQQASAVVRRLVERLEGVGEVGEN